MRILLQGEAPTPALRAAVARITDVLEAWGALGAAEGDVRLAVGADDPQLIRGESATPLLVLPACGPGRPAPWARALVGVADAVVLIDPAEMLDLRTALRSRAVLTCGVPRPVIGPSEQGLDTGDAPGGLAAVWEAEYGPIPDVGPGVSWVRGYGAEPLVAATQAWAVGRAVITLPGTPAHGLLRLGGALEARTTLEAIEATKLLCGTPPLAHALVRRGRAALAVLPTAQQAAATVIEAAEVALA